MLLITEKCSEVRKRFNVNWWTTFDTLGFKDKKQLLKNENFTYQRLMYVKLSIQAKQKWTNTDWRKAATSTLVFLCISFWAVCTRIRVPRQVREYRGKLLKKHYYGKIDPSSWNLAPYEYTLVSTVFRILVACWPPCILNAVDLPRNSVDICSGIPSN